MATTIHLNGRITEAGELKVDLPADLPAGNVRVTLELAPEQQTDIPWEERPWTEEEIRELMTFRPTPGTEVIASGLAGGWEDMGITDSAAWVEEQRRKQEAERRHGD